MYKYPLANINHSWLDRLKLAFFFINPKNRWSISDRVKEVEGILAEKSGYKYCVTTSSGSTANTLVSMWIQQNTKKRKVIVPAISWSTSITPFIFHGFEPIFVDVGERDPVMDYKKLDEVLEKHSDEIACVFYTTLLGIRNQNLYYIENICDKHGVDLYIDACEDTDGIFYSKTLCGYRTKANNIKAETTSFYLAHEYQSCPEMGAIFTNDKEQYEYYLCARNHGMLRSLDSETQNKVKNNLVDSKFDFPILGNNFRPTEISAYGLILDLKRTEKYKRMRKEIPEKFYNSTVKKIVPYKLDYMFALPIVVNRNHSANPDKLIDDIKNIVEELSIESRPIVGGNLLRQTCFQKYGNYLDYPNAEWFHKYGIYIGLYPKMDMRLLKTFKKKLIQIDHD